MRGTSFFLPLQVLFPIASPEVKVKIKNKQKNHSIFPSDSVPRIKINVLLYDIFYRCYCYNLFIMHLKTMSMSTSYLHKVFWLIVEGMGRGVVLINTLRFWMCFKSLKWYWYISARWACQLLFGRKYVCYMYTYETCKFNIIA